MKMKQYFFRHKGSLSLWMILEILDAAASISFALYLQSMTDLTVSGKDVKAVLRLIPVGIAVVAAIGLTAYLKRHFQMRFSREALLDLKQDVFSRILSADINGFHSNKSAKYISILNNDIAMIDADYFQCIPNMAANLFTLAIASAVMFFFQPVLAAVSIGMGFLPMSIPMLFGKRISRRQKKYNESLDEYNAKIKDVFNGFEIIKSFHVEDRTCENHRRENINVEDSHFRLREIQNMLGGASRATAFFVNVVVIAVASVFAIDGIISPGTMIGAIQVLNSIVNPIQLLAKYATDYKSSRPIVSRLRQILNLSRESGSTLLPLESATPISVRHLTFSYRQAKTVINDVTFTFEKGKKYAIVGTSGSGKSTFVHLLMHYYDDFGGAIQFGDQNILEIDRGSLYRQIAMIHQNVILFDGTLRDNITMFEPYAEEKIEQAAVQAGMGNYLKEKGLESRVSEDGRNLSGGERQRIAIARAFLRETPVMIMDEAVSSLDNATAAQIDNAVLNSDTTALVITHRLKEEILIQFDDIIVFHQGKIVEHGAYRYLLSRKGYFYSLCFTGVPTL